MEIPGIVEGSTDNVISATFSPTNLSIPAITSPRMVLQIQKKLQ